MSLLHAKYRYLKATESYLTDKVVLAQAWKKTHDHIRSTNWYADNFELDRSAANLEKLLDTWRKEVAHSKDFTFKQLKLVLAPKSSKWGFTKTKPSDFDTSSHNTSNELYPDINHRWEPCLLEGESASLRPLAHIHIRDQTIMTALMMCLANQAEASQGNPKTSFNEVHQKGVVNYGNRLFCIYTDSGKPLFGWGNSKTYNQYFSDYQTFLARPAHFGRLATEQKDDKSVIYEVHLDFERFFDNVNRELLVDKIKNEFNLRDDLVDRILTCFVNWKWKKSSREIYAETCSNDGENPPEGIPQGLVAGGFLANIYMLDFDRWLSKVTGTFITEGIELLDCCRYVDDIRLIVSSEEKDKEKVKILIEKVFTRQLLLLDLSLNDGKTKVVVFKQTKNGISKKLNDIQRKVSGPISLNEVNDQLGHLDGLIGLAETLRDDQTDDENNNPLALIESSNDDVREDTLLRFSANKIAMLLAQKRSLTAQEVTESGAAVAGDWDFLQEHMARRLIGCWSRDPSLVLLLKKGLELFPDKRLLKPILDQLTSLRLRKISKQARIGEYCLGEIFRHSATVIRHKNTWANPAHADVASYLEYLQEFASYALDHPLDKQGHLNVQLSFFMVVMNDSPPEKGFANKNMTFVSKLMKGSRLFLLQFHQTVSFVTFFWPISWRMISH